MSRWFNRPEWGFPSEKDLIVGTSLRSPKGSIWVVTSMQGTGHATTYQMRQDGIGPLVLRRAVDLRGWTIVG